MRALFLALLFPFAAFGQGVLMSPSSLVTSYSPEEAERMVYEETNNPGLFHGYMAVNLAAFKQAQLTLTTPAGQTVTLTGVASKADQDFFEAANGLFPRQASTGPEWSWVGRGGIWTLTATSPDGVHVDGSLRSPGIFYQFSGVGNRLLFAERHVKRPNQVQPTESDVEPSIGGPNKAPPGPANDGNTVRIMSGEPVTWSKVRVLAVMTQSAKAYTGATGITNDRIRNNASLAFKQSCDYPACRSNAYFTATAPGSNELAGDLYIEVPDAKYAGMTFSQILNDAKADPVIASTRNFYKADVVVVFVRGAGTNPNGTEQGRSFGYENGGPAWAFAVVNVEAEDYSLEHELGHIFGMAHGETNQKYGGNQANNAFPTAHGNNWPVTGNIPAPNPGPYKNCWRTIMAYSSSSLDCPPYNITPGQIYANGDVRIGYFSHNGNEAPPDGEGIRTGDTYHNNMGVLSTTADVVAHYHDTPTSGGGGTLTPTKKAAAVSAIIVALLQE